MLSQLSRMHALKECDKSYLSADENQNVLQNLNDILAVEKEENQRVFQKALEYINAEGRVPPSDLWEYQVGLSCIYSTPLCLHSPTTVF